MQLLRKLLRWIRSIFEHERVVTTRPEEPDYQLLPAEETWRGRGKSLEEAVDDGWQRAAHAGAAAGTYRVVDLLVVAENPISEYRIALGRGG